MLYKSWRRSLRKYFAQLIPCGVIFGLAFVAGVGLGQDAELDSTEPAAATTTTTEVSDENSDATVKEAPVETQRGRRSTYNDVMFGSYRVRLSVNRPEFNDDLKYYDELYGSPKNYGMIGADWFAWDWYATLGLGFRTGFYAANGERVKGGSVDLDNPDPDNFEKTGRTSLTVIPVQALLTMEFSPFKKKWIVIDGWFGAEYAYWQEVRVDDEDTTSAAKSAFVLAASESSSDGDLTNRGWAPATVAGVAANILLNPLDDRSARSMESTMGIGYVYLSPFAEVITSTSDKGVKWGRKVVGVGFTFETIK